MKINVETLKSRNQTADGMKNIVERYFNDLDDIPESDIGIVDFFDRVRSIPYKRDIKPIEVIGRPKILWDQQAGGLDCKKKAILIASYARRRWGPGSYRFVAVSSRPDKMVHHVLPEISFNGGDTWIRSDATYKNMRLGWIKPYTRTIIL